MHSVFCTEDLLARLRDWKLRRVPPLQGLWASASADFRNPDLQLSSRHSWMVLHSWASRAESAVDEASYGESVLRLYVLVLAASANDEEAGALRGSGSGFEEFLKPLLHGSEKPASSRHMQWQNAVV